ncbi:TIGR03619 family F420-dependent LLM class oxidoreductase [Streptomyces sp. SP18CS02]|uniref:TIGR03619 family F420-dependent LLM class oxidoreductase n=1 Tax=Streptomyces sp. SP18CS02 TaxID=3002531 RepID=UPI002E798627|nr:TIGR03619 family F420-dependent LLM class oxidoreductase [Streptomyces sp. SP18CS02]MEE1756458.1 TIGR03619 family F420-dependent LLM class oxidoreductase [Streptomyces sp. SP18CS02]
MKFGVNIVNNGPNAKPETLRHWVQQAEETGYHLITVSDHVATTQDVHDTFPTQLYDPFVTLAWFAALTSRIELATSVVITPLRSPLNTARLTANIDRLSNGRMVLGVGTGWAKGEFDALKVSHRQRARITDEYLGVIKRLWTEDVVTHHGEFADFERVHTAPRPLRDPHPPLWIGGSGPRSVRRIATYADAWHPIWATTEWLRTEGLPALRDAAEQAGRPVPALCPRVNLRITDSPLTDPKRLPGEGTLDQIRQDLEELAELGAQYVVFDNYPAVEDREHSPEALWELFQVLADKVIDLDGQTLR